MTINVTFFDPKTEKILDKSFGKIFKNYVYFGGKNGCKGNFSSKISPNDQIFLRNIYNF